jgi:hypothetical protein
MRMVDHETPTSVYPLDRGTMLDAAPGNGTSVEAIVGVGQLIKGIRVGVAGKYVEDNVPALRVSRGALDLGVSKDLFTRYTFALAVQNIGASTEVPCATTRTCTPPPGNTVPNPTTPVRLPLRSTFGVQAQGPVGEFDLMATAAVWMLRADWFGASGGAELGYSWLSGYSIALRAGARSTLPGEAAFTAGAGFNMDRLSIDYAAEALTGSRFGQRIGLRVR